MADEQLSIGEMPEPCYMQETNGIRWIGMQAYGLDEKIKDFI